MIDIESEGNLISFSSNDDGSDLYSIGFDFPFYGDSYQSFL